MQGLPAAACRLPGCPRLSEARPRPLQYMADLNRTNPLGLKGELAEAFGQLMNLLWAVRGPGGGPPRLLTRHPLSW